MFSSQRESFSSFSDNTETVFGYITAIKLFFDVLT